MNIDLYEELSVLISDKKQIESFLEQLKKNNYSKLIALNKGLYRYYFDDDLIPVLINYFEEKIKKIDDKISKFKLSKTID